MQVADHRVLRLHRSRAQIILLGKISDATGINTSKIGQSMTEIDDKSAASAPTRKFRVSDPNEIGRHSDWAFDFRQIESGPMGMDVATRVRSRVTLTEFQFDSGVHQMGCSPVDAVSFGLPLTSGIRSWCGADADTPGIINFGSGAEFEGVTNAAFAGLTVSVSPAFLSSVSDQLGLPHPGKFLRKTMIPVNRKPQSLRGLQELGQMLLHHPNSPFCEVQQENLVAELVSAASDVEWHEDRSTFSVRSKAVTLAIEFMNDQLADGISITQVCAATRASSRTLTRGFCERFGIGPKAYLNCLRLCRVRSELLRNPPDCSVVNAANKWGFWHMGQFAKDYKKMFAELPSQTLQNAKGN